jgi:hypothetical protein
VGKVSSMSTRQGDEQLAQCGTGTQQRHVAALGLEVAQALE